MNFCIAILVLKMEENMQHFQHIMLYYFKKGENTAEMQKKKRFVHCVEKVLQLIKCVKSGLRSFMLETFLWMMLQGQVGQLKLIVNKLRH